MFFLLLQNSRKVVPLHRVFHSIRFKVNKGWAQRSPFFMSIFQFLYISERSRIVGNGFMLFRSSRNLVGILYCARHEYVHSIGIDRGTARILGDLTPSRKTN